MKAGVIVNRTGSQTLTALSFLCLSTLFCAGVDHNPSWSGNTLSYGLPVTNYIDEFDPGDYGMCHFGNWLDECAADFPTAKSLYFNQLTLGPFTNGDMDNPHRAGLFLWHMVDSQVARRTFTSASAGWSASSDNSGKVTFNALRGMTELYRYFTYKDEQLPGLDSATKKYVILIHGWNPDSNIEAYGNEPDGGQFYRLYNNVNTWIGNNGASSWKVLKYHMERDTDTGPVSIDAAINGTEAAEIARLHGYHMAKLILQKCPNIEKVHLVAHSAGSWAARSCLQYLLANSSQINCQMTLLDAFVPAAVPLIDSTLDVPGMNRAATFTGNNRISILDNYYSYDLFVLGTQNEFNWGSHETVPDTRTDIYGFDKYDGHSGPVEYYSDSVAEAGSWSMAGGWKYSIAYADMQPDGTWMSGFSASPSPVVQGSGFYLTAFNVRHPQGNAISQVAFYRDANGNQAYDPLTDELVGYGTKQLTDWQLYKSANWNSGTHRFFARAKDAFGNYGQARMLTLTITFPPAQQGSWLSVTTKGFSDEHGSGDNDDVIECGEDIECRIKLRSSADVTTIMGTLSSSLDNLQITDNEEQWPQIAANTEAYCDGGFNMMLDMAQTYSVPFTLYVEYMKGGVDYYQTFTFNKTFYAQGERDSAFSIVSLAIDDSPTISSGNNGDGIIQAGESVRVRPLLRNIGQAGATDIELWLTYAGDKFELEDYESYPDLSPGQESYPLGSSTYSIRSIVANYTGSQYVDAMVKCEQHLNGYAIQNGLEINIQPAAWLRMSDREYDFGVVTPGTYVTFTTLVQNVGCAWLEVTGYTASHADTTCSMPTLPFSLDGGQSTTVVVRINTTNMQSAVTRQVTVQSTGRVNRPGTNDTVQFTGFVGRGTPLGNVPNTTACYHPDISGSKIVWNDGSSGNQEVYLYDIRTGLKQQITSNTYSQFNPHISGNLVVWNDKRNNPTGDWYDIYACDLTRPDLGNIALPVTGSGSELIGVDGNLVAVSHIYHFFTERSNWDTARNLIVYEYQGNGQFVQRFHSGFTANTSYNPMQSIEDDGDFGSGLLIVRRHEIWWNTEPTVDYWDTRNQRFQIINYRVGQSSLSDAGTRWYDWPCAERDRFVYAEWDANNDNQIYLRRTDNSVQQLTSLPHIDYADDVLAIGGSDGNDCVLYNFRDSTRPGLYYIDRFDGTEHIISTTLRPDELRMDGLAAVVVDNNDGNRLKYILLKSPDISIASANVSISPEEPTEETPLNISVLIRNLTSYAQPSNIVINIYRGDPDSNGVSLAQSQVFNGLNALTDLLVVFSNVPALAEGNYTIYAKITVDALDVLDNNKASRALTVSDNDMEPPLITNMLVSEINGDGDGVIGNDEQFRIAWGLSDYSGITSTSIRVDGLNVPYQGAYYIDYGPIATGLHTISIAATDADASPESRTNTYQLRVVTREKIGVSIAERQVTNNITTPIELGLFYVDVPANPSAFTLRNDGEQRLQLQSLHVTGHFTKDGPGLTNVPPAGFTWFEVAPDTTVTGAFVGTVIITNSDAQCTPFSFPVSYTVVPEATLIMLIVAGTLVALRKRCKYD